MKKVFTLSFLYLCITCNAQSIDVKEGHAKFSSGSHDAVSSVIYENKVKEVIHEWKKIMKDYKHEKVKDDDNEVFGDNILIKDWGNNPVDIYARFDENEKEKTIKMSVAVDLGGTYLNASADKDKHHYIEKMVKEFAVKMTKAPIEEQLKDSKKTEEKLEDKLKDLEKDKKDKQEDIENYKKKIVKGEKEIIEKESALEKKKDEVKTQKKVVDASKDAVSEQAKSSKKILDKLEDQQNDLEKDIKELKNDNEDFKEKIKKAEKEIKENEEEQVKKKKEIEEQKKTTAEIKKKLDKVE